MPIDVQQKFRVTAPNGAIRGSLFGDLQSALNDAATVNATNDASYAHVVIPVLHSTEV